MESETRFQNEMMPVRDALHMYSAANDPETANDPRPQMIPKLDRK